MRHILIILAMTAFAAQKAVAQQWHCAWIAHPTAADTTQVWFRRSYENASLSREAYIDIASTGFFTLYVNGRNVSTDILTPLRQQGDATPRSMTFDVKRFLRRGENTIAVWYSPSSAHKDLRQLSLNFYGTDSEGEPFSFLSDGSWLCREANMTLTTDGGEMQDATLYNMKWNTADFDLVLWLPAMETEGTAGESIMADRWQEGGSRTVSVMQPRYFDVTDEGVLYDFAPGFYGFVRVTLRDCKRGQRISINGLRYTCNGDMDEQAFGRFAPTFCRKVLIKGDEDFSREQVQSVEAIAIAP